MSSTKDAKKDKGPPRPQEHGNKAAQKPKSSLVVVVMGVVVVAVVAVVLAPRLLGSRSSATVARADDARLIPQLRNVAPGEIVRGNA